jgi:hypothetical protein
MIIDTDKLLVGVELLKNYLHESIVTVAFVKKDGTDRVMRCTQDVKRIPADLLAKANTPNTTDPQLFKVYDVECKAWRSFRYCTVKTIAMNDTLPTTNV